MAFIASSLSLGQPFLTKDLYALFFFRMKFLIYIVFQGDWQGLSEAFENENELGSSKNSF